MFFLSSIKIEGLVANVPDIPRIYTAIAEFMACMVFVLLLRKRFSGYKLFLMSVLCFVIILGIQLLGGILPIYLWIPGMAAAMLAMYVTIYLLTKSKPFEAIFWTARAFVLAEFAASIEWQFYYYATQNVELFKNKYLELIFLVLTFAIVFITAYFLEKRYSKSNLYLNISRGALYSALAIAIAIFLIGNISFISNNTPLSGQYASEIFYIRTLVDLCGLILLYALQEQRLWVSAKIELDAMQNILSRQYEQYRLSKDNIELLNRRYHDLKHQIAVIKEESSPQKKIEYLEDMERGIRIFEIRNDTGSHVLDVILSGKNMFCVENDINFTCVADGSLLSFMDVMDICSIFGNALDNAFESVVKVENKEKRIVKMAVFSQNDFLMIRIENYIENRPVCENGIPITTKVVKENHGYGIKSIKSATEKYGGSMKINIEENWFSLCLLIPLDKRI